MSFDTGIQEKIYRYLQSKQNDEVSIREVFSTPCPNFVVSRAVGVETEFPVISGPVALVREYDRRLRLKVRSLLVEAYQGKADLYDPTITEHWMFCFKDTDDGRLLGLPVYIASVGFEEYTRAAAGQIPSDVLAAASIIGRADDGVILLLIDRNTQAWMTRVVETGVRELSDEVLKDGATIAAIFLGDLPAVGVGTPEDCARCPYNGCVAFTSGQVFNHPRRIYSVENLSFGDDPGIMEDLHATLRQLQQRQGERRRESCFHPSEVAAFECDRRQAYSLLQRPDVRSTRREWRGGDFLLRIFMAGHILHEIVQEALVEEVPGYQIEVSGALPALSLYGSIDGIEPSGIVNEFKSMGAKSWEKATKPEPKHVMQGLMYARMTGAETVRYVYINKDNGLIRELLVPFDRRQWHAIAERLERIQGIVAAGQLPPEIHSSECDECPFHTKCKKQRYI